MRLRRVETRNSVWIFDLDLERYVRLPRVEAPTFSVVEYTGLWEPYVKIEEMGDTLMVHRPVEWGKGQLRQTGPIISDETSES